MATQCEICHKSLKTITIDEKKWMACKNPYCSMYGTGIARSSEPTNAPKANRSKKYVPRRQGS